MNFKLKLQIRTLHQEMSNAPAVMQYRLSDELPWENVASHMQCINGNILDEGGEIVSYGRGNQPNIVHEDTAAYLDPTQQQTLKAMAANTNYKITPVDPRAAQLVDSETIGYLPPLSEEALKKPHPFTDFMVSMSDLIYTDGYRHVRALTDPEDRQGGTKGHLYQVSLSDKSDKRVTLDFQNGNPAVYGINGHTNETVLSILIHRMEYLDTLFPCDENKEGLKHLKLAKEAFEARAERLKKKD